MDAPGWRHGQAALWLAGVLAVGCADPPRPNILLITVDTLRADHTSVYGYGRDTTPRLRALAEQGLRFARAYAPTSTTAPSHASLFSGRYPPVHGVVKNGVALGEELPLLAELLARESYRTGAVVSSFVLSRKFGFARGFELYDDAFSVETSGSGEVGSWAGHEVAGAFDRRANATTDRAIEWLRGAREAPQPFFLFVHYFDPHAPYSAPSEFAFRYFEDATEGEGEEGQRLANQIRQYDAEIAFTDDEIGRLLDALDAQGIADETWVVITADHGEGLMDHGHMLHGIDVYEEAVRVPLLMRWPGRLSPGRVEDERVEILGLAAAVVELLDIDPTPARFEDRGLASILRGGEGAGEQRPVFLFRRHYQHGVLNGIPVRGEKYAVIERDLKYVEAEDGSDRELYDLSVDPGELANKIELETARAAPLEERLAAWKARQGRSGEAPALSEEDRAALEALGYVE